MALLSTTISPSYSTPLTFNHPQLGSLQGLLRHPCNSNTRIAQFRGIPYATIPARFRQSVPLTSLPSTPFNATQPGPICPQPTNVPFPPLWDGPLAPDGVELAAPRQDEFGCLVLNVTAPVGALADPEVNGGAGDDGEGAKEGGEREKLLPVLLHIHGGAFIAGSSSIQVSGREIADPVRLVAASVKLGRPVVVVSVNYRVGPLGFLAGRELAELNQGQGEEVGNYGLGDLKRAVLWVRRFVGGFGGDAGEICVQGGSAGGAGSHFMALLGDDGKVEGKGRGSLVRRGILSSGTALAIGAMGMEWHQTKFGRFVEKFVAEGDKGDMVNALQGVDVQELVNSKLAGFWNPLIDGNMIKGRTATALMESPTSVDLMIGSCAYEQDVTLAMIGALGPNATNDEAMRKAVWNMLEPVGLTAKTERLFEKRMLEAYGLEGSVEKPSAMREVWAELVADGVFRVPPFLVAEASKGKGEADGTRGKVWLYEFEATNPYPNWKLGYGKANHAISDIFLFDPARDMVPEEHVKEYEGAVNRWQRECIRFCYGEVGWRPVDSTREKDRSLHLGPVYSFGNGAKGGEKESMAEIVNEVVIKRWKRLLEAADI